MARARFKPEEVISLTLEFYRRNYIEGLFLSSGIIRSPDETMGDMVRIVRELRTIHHFRSYIHLKTIPDADPRLIEEAGLHADRLSLNVELPDDASVRRLAPEKDPATIRIGMGAIRLRIEESKEPTLVRKLTKHFSPAGQSTQMIVGADQTTDAAFWAAATG